jgi:hypothetical protein
VVLGIGKGKWTIDEGRKQIKRLTTTFNTHGFSGTPSRLNVVPEVAMG